MKVKPDPNILKNLAQQRQLKCTSIAALSEEPFEISQASAYRAFQGEMVELKTIRALAAFFFAGDYSRWKELVVSETRVLSIVLNPQNIPRELSTKNEVLKWFIDIYGFQIERHGLSAKIDQLTDGGYLIAAIKSGSIELEVVVRKQDVPKIIQAFEQGAFLEDDVCSVTDISDRKIEVPTTENKILKILIVFGICLLFFGALWYLRGTEITPSESTVHLRFAGRPVIEQLEPKRKTEISLFIRNDSDRRIELSDRCFLAPKAEGRLLPEFFLDNGSVPIVEPYSFQVPKYKVNNLLSSIGNLESKKYGKPYEKFELVLPIIDFETTEVIFEKRIPIWVLFESARQD